MRVRDIEPLSYSPLKSELEIYLLVACDVVPKNNVDAWYALRNMHRYGALVTAGCWDTCSGSWTPINTTWNEIGDEIADGQDTIWNAWKDGFTVLFFDDDIVIQGLGRIGAENCDNRAANVTFQNRNNYYEYTYGHDAVRGTGDDDMEFCGYYLTNW